ncbi:MAG: type II CRISPR-associated endonuclease Cas1 [bacterium]|nr:type II CRISPR-associated endonuclease Cas1 [bacterium]
MIKRTLYFGNPAYLKTSNEQLVITLPELKSGLNESDRSTSIPIEDIGILILDHQQITISQALIAKLLANNVAFITCDSSHHPTGLMLNLDGNTLQAERYTTQINASVPLKKQLWAQTIEQKISNQAVILRQQNQGNHLHLMALSQQVRSGDPDNMEGRAAAYYWKHIFGEDKAFLRDREGTPPNHLLNYGYSLIRAGIARALVGSGLIATLGIHHRNKYNAYCLADDIMEPYRPIVDNIVCRMLKAGQVQEEITKDNKQTLLQIFTHDVLLDGEKSPLLIAMQRTTASLVKCFEGTQRKILYPEIINLEG